MSMREMRGLISLFICEIEYRSQGKGGFARFIRLNRREWSESKAESATSQNTP
jgi:hypothetical protein